LALLAATASPSAAATGQPSGPYTGMGTCPTSCSWLLEVEPLAQLATMLRFENVAKTWTWA